MNKSLAAQRFELAYKAVHLQCLDQEGAPIAGADASGFIRREGGESYLYTCWHAVTGCAMHGLGASPVLPKRMALAVTLQEARAPLGADTGGNQRRLQLPLYDASGRPSWFQDRKDDPQPGLQTAHFRVPFYHDAIKLRLPPDAGIANIQAVEEGCFLEGNTAMPGDKVLLVGYPRGYGVPESGQAVPVMLTRFIAATRVPGRKRELLLDGFGAPGMPGAPVFIEREESIYLLGLYTGSIYPHQASEKAAALGACCDMTVCWKRTPLQPYTVLG